MQDLVRSKSASSTISAPSKRIVRQPSKNPLAKEIKPIPSRNKIEKQTTPTISITNPSSTPTTLSPVKSNAVKNSQQYLSIVEQCRKSKKKFVDADFPPNASSLYIDSQNPHPDWPKSIQWKRIPDFCPNPQLFTNGIEAGDVIQGVLGGKLLQYDF